LSAELTFDKLESCGAENPNAVRRGAGLRERVPIVLREAKPDFVAHGTAIALSWSIEAWITAARNLL
jgi:hypothetical protein